ncbi:MAG TPA: diguanylate cyclase, partial [Oxalicibacterium sp.]|nr:diguanylate cyclase [Oxalicibacterium sp.]
KKSGRISAKAIWPAALAAKKWFWCFPNATWHPQLSGPKPSGAASPLRAEHGGRELGVTAPLGIATCPNHGTDAAAPLHTADQALYEAKRSGRNRVAIAHPQPV